MARHQSGDAVAHHHREQRAAQTTSRPARGATCISMGIRTVCFVAAIFVASRWLRVGADRGRAWCSRTSPW